jgi:hypothetical protein
MHEVHDHCAYGSPVDVDAGKGLMAGSLYDLTDPVRLSAFLANARSRRPQSAIGEDPFPTSELFRVMSLEGSPCREPCLVPPERMGQNG